MDLLREIDHLEPDRKGTGQVPGSLWGAATRLVTQLQRPGGVALAAADRRDPVGLHMVKQLCAALFAENFPDQPT